MTVAASGPRSAQDLYAPPLSRYTIAMRNRLPDRVPLRPLPAEITPGYAGCKCQEVTHDYANALQALVRWCSDLEWDAGAAIPFQAGSGDYVLEFAEAPIAPKCRKEPVGGEP
jgi:hypothetical protein